MRSSRFMRLHFALALSLSVYWAWAQQAPPKPPGQTPAPAQEGPAKFTANVQLVVETVTVTDKSGKPVEGLTAKDFTVTEDNVPQNISFCEAQKLIDTPPAAPTNPEPAPSIAGTDKPADKAADKPKLPAPGVTSVEISTERPGDIKYRDRRLIGLYFDMGAMPVTDQLRSQAAAVKFLRTQMQPADLVAVFAFSDRLHVLQDFTDDRVKVAEIIEKLFIGEDQGFDEASNDDSSADVGSAFGEDDSEFNIFNTDRQLAALQTAVKMLGSLNEKKVLVYFASGLRLNGVDNQAMLQSTTNAAIRANVAFFTVDARGLVASAPLGDATRGSPGGIGMYNGASAMAASNSFMHSQDNLYALAKDTGGKALLDNNDLSMGVVQAEQSISSYYIIGYYSQNQNADGKFRRVKITLNGHPDYKLDYHQGYFGPKVFSKFTKVDKETQLHDALMLGDPITELTIQMEVNYFQLNSAEYFIPVTMKIPGSELAYARRHGADHTVIEYIGEVKDEYNVTVANVRDTADIKLTGETAERLAHQPIQYNTGFTLLPGTYSIKVLARDDETGHIGTYINKFVVPNLNKEQQRIPISSVVLSGQRLDRKDAVFTAGKDKTPSVSPLIQDGQELIPSVTRVFSKRRDMFVYLQAYERTAASVQPLVAFVTFYRGQAKAFETAPIEVTEGMDNKLHTVPLRFSLSLGKLQPGKYDCQVSVVDPNGQKAAFWTAPVMVVQ
jgi:VWFA-related protein